MPDENKHFEPTADNRKGYFEKNKSREYRATCLSGGRGYLSDWHQAHHILPETCFEKSVEQISPDDKRVYIENCKWVTDWNLNETYNLMGLPRLWSYMLAYQKTHGKGDERNKVVSKRYGKIQLIKDRSKIISETFIVPKDYPVHNPVNWGHIDFNEEVSDWLKIEIWDHLDEKKEEHKINPESIRSYLDKGTNYFYNELINRGGREGGTEVNWPKRNEPGNTTWYHPFSMALDPEEPL